MIEQNTVLILGAGASVPLGYPSGVELKNKVIEDLSPNSYLTSVLTESSGYANVKPIINKIRDALVGSTAQSVDAFLEGRREYVDVGKVAMALALLECEDASRLSRTAEERGDWYHYLWQWMRAGVGIDDFGKNRLSVITFNYDLSLEHFLHRTMRHTYGVEKHECYAPLEQIEIAHVHGSLKTPKGDATEMNYGERSRDARAIRDAASSIKIVHEGDEGDTEFARAHAMLDAADIVCFLGFGYGDVNLDRLQLRRCTEARFIAGSCFKKKHAEMLDARDEVGRRWKPATNRVIMGDPAWDCIQFLRETTILGRTARFNKGERSFKGASYPSPSPQGDD